LDHYSINRDHVRSVGGEARNSLAVVESRVEEHQSVIYRNGAADFEMSMEDVEAVNYSDYGAFISAGTVFAGEPSRTAAFKSMELARENGLPVIFDVDYRPYSWPSAEIASQVYSKAADLCDIVVGNDVEFGFMAGDYDKGLNKARHLAETSAQIVVYKMGEKGSITFADGIEFETGIFPTKPLKPTGAGDAFMGGFVSSLADGMSVSQSVRRGSASAAIVVSRVGCAPAMPTTEELDQFISEYSETA
ncbi:MAG: PfkB family carbohydrate kinase, partial [Rhizobiaceae bacterium]